MVFPFNREWGLGHANCLIIYKKSSKNSRFLVLIIPFWVQNNRSKDFFEILFSLTGCFWGQKEWVKTILRPALGLFCCYVGWLPWPDPTQPVCSLQKRVFHRQPERQDRVRHAGAAWHLHKMWRRCGTGCRKWMKLMESGLSISSKQHPQYLCRLEVAICDFQSRYYGIEL